MKLGPKDRQIASAHSLIIFECTDMGPDDGNRYFVCHKQSDHSASLMFAINEGALDGNGQEELFRLTEVQLIWLNREADKISDY